MAMRLAEDAVNIRADAIGAARSDRVAGRAFLELRLAARRACGLEKECDWRLGCRIAAGRRFFLDAFNPIAPLLRPIRGKLPTVDRTRAVSGKSLSLRLDTS